MLQVQELHTDPHLHNNSSDSSNRTAHMPSSQGDNSDMSTQPTARCLCLNHHNKVSQWHTANPNRIPAHRLR